MYRERVLRGDSEPKTKSGKTRPMRLLPAPPDEHVPLTRGSVKPRAIAWFGFTAFWGHLRHLAASAIATENIDSRQWMIPEAPDELLARLLDVIGGDKTKSTMLDAMNGETWIDFVADTGDDVSVSEAVARMVFREYEIEEDGKRLILPRGDIMMLGGDLAYPVATVSEVTRRLVDPWNRVLEKCDDGKPRALLAIPGNHDWYDGLDGFARLCQAPCAFEEETSPSDQPKPHDNWLLAWAEAFSRGEALKKPKSVALRGYVPVQRVSYFRLPLADGLELWGVDRQLREIDPRQTAFFKVDTGASARVIVLPDPIRAWGEPQANGVKSRDALGLAADRDPMLIMTGDIHHYERSEEGPSTHVISGGGGAFLHGARVGGEATVPGAYRRVAEFPGPCASGAMLWSLPWHVGIGRAGLLVSGGFALFDAIELVAHLFKQPTPAPFVLFFAVAIGTALLVGWRNHRVWRVIPFAILTAFAIGEVPLLLGIAAEHYEKMLFGHSAIDKIIGVTIASIFAAFCSGAAFGVMLALIARFGLNHAQPYAALGLPGYKNFVRMRITKSADGKGVVDAFAIGIVDPLGKKSEPCLVDRFRFSGKH